MQHKENQTIGSLCVFLWLCVSDNDITGRSCVYMRSSSGRHRLMVYLYETIFGNTQKAFHLVSIRQKNWKKYSCKEVVDNSPFDITEGDEVINIAFGYILRGV